MDRMERVFSNYAVRHDFDVEYVGDIGGNKSPPDFVMDGNVAVEVTYIHMNQDVNSIHVEREDGIKEAIDGRPVLNFHGFRQVLTHKFNEVARKYGITTGHVCIEHNDSTRKLPSRLKDKTYRWVPTGPVKYYDDADYRGENPFREGIVRGCGRFEKTGLSFEKKFEYVLRALSKLSEKKVNCWQYFIYYDKGMYDYIRVEWQPHSKLHFRYDGVSDATIEHTYSDGFIKELVRWNETKRRKINDAGIRNDYDKWVLTVVLTNEDCCRYVMGIGGAKGIASIVHDLGDRLKADGWDCVVLLGHDSGTGHEWVIHTADLQGPLFA